MHATASSTLPADLAERFVLISRDPWAFLEHCVFTLDQTDEHTPIKRFPANDPNMSEYLRLYVRLWQQEKRMASPKSRRMFMTWTNIALHLHVALFGIGKGVGVISKKAEDSDELLKRMVFIYEHIPESVIPKKLLPKLEVVEGLIRIPELNSFIKAFAQGDDQLRQYTLSAIMADEMAFWERAQAAYSSSVPTLEGGGRFTAISSPAPGFFRQLVDDRLDNKEDAIEAKDIKHPLPGVDVWRNRKNKFVIFQLHYSANVKKRDPKYIEDVRASMPRAQFMQEYELQWESFLGKPVYQDFDVRRHISKDTIYPEIGLPLLRSYDWGLTPACIVGQLVEGQLRILCEFVAEGMGATKFCAQVLSTLKIMYPTWSDQKKNWRDFIDPAGFSRDQSNDEASCAQVLVKLGCSPAPGVIAFEGRKKSVDSLLIRHTKEGPGIIIDPSCKILIDGFKGGYHYPEKASEIEPAKVRPLKNEYSHPHDALQYMCSRVTELGRSRGPGVGAPSYSFGQPTKIAGVQHGSRIG